MNEIINKTDGTILKWSKTPDNNYFCLLYSDNKNNYSFTPTTNLNCKLFMIGGGGAGGYYFGGGGGAGAAYYNEKFTFKQGITYNFTIGNGGKCDIDDFNSLFSQGLSLNIYNNVNIDFNNISFSLDDYSSLNINNSGLIQNFIVNNYDTNINIPNSIWNNNTFYIWSGYIIPTTNDEYIKININTNINTAIWIDNYMYKNDNALILNTNNNYLNDVKIIKIDPKRYYNIKIIAYCNNNSSNNNFSISFSNNCSLYNYNKNNEKYLYLNATDTVLNYNDPSLETPINTLICNGGGNGGCGFYNQNNNLDGGCGGGSGINKKNGNTIINNSIFKGTNGAIGSFCGGGGGIQTTGKDNIGGDGIILDWFDNKLFFGCGGNGGNFKDNRNLGYGCGGNGGDCCYYSKEMINNNGKNGCVLIYINLSEPFIERFGNRNRNKEIETFYNYVSDINNNLMITQVYKNSMKQITDCTNSTGKSGINNSQPIYETSKPSNGNIGTSYAGYFNPTYSSFPTKPGDTSTFTAGAYNPGDFADGIDTFYNYFKYNPSYIYDILCFHKCIIGLYKILYQQITNNPYDLSIYNNLKILLIDNATSSYTNKIITLANIFNINVNQFTTTLQAATSPPATDYFTNQYKSSDQYTRYFYGNNNADATSLGLSDDCFNFKYIDNTNDGVSTFPILPFYNLYNSTNNTLTDLTYIKEYLTNDFTNTYDYLGSGTTTNKVRTNNFINSITELASGITLSNVTTAYNRIASEIGSSNFGDATFSRHDKEMQLLYLSIFKDVLDSNSMSKICGRLYFYAQQFNLIIINLNLQYGLYRLLFTTLSNRKYIKHSTTTSTTSTTYYLPFPTTTNEAGIGKLITTATTAIGGTSGTKINTSNYNTSINNSISMLVKYADLCRVLKIKNVNAKIFDVSLNNDTVSKDLMTFQLKLNKIIKKYNDELQVYNTTLNIYKAIIVIAIILLILIIYIFTLDTNVLNKSSKISTFIILGGIIFGLSFYFIYNNSLLYENFTNNYDNKKNVKEGFTISNINDGVDVINDCHIYANYTKAISITSYKNYGNAPNSFTGYKNNYQGLITNFIYLAGIIAGSRSTTTTPFLLDNDIDFTNYNKNCSLHFDYLKYYIASSFNIIQNSDNMINTTNNIITYKTKRKDFYINRYSYYVNSIEALKNNIYIYYYLSILYALCIVLLLFSLIIILILGHSIQSIISTSILSFLIVLIVVYYIYFKLHHRTRMQISKKYWAYNNPSDTIFQENS